MSVSPYGHQEALKAHRLNQCYSKGAFFLMDSRLALALEAKSWGEIRSSPEQ